MIKIEELIKKFKAIKEDVCKMDSAPPPPPPPTLGSTATAGGTKTINSQIGNPFGKADEAPKKTGGHSSFTMEHVNAVVKMPHSAAKAHAHAAVDSSTANDQNKAKMKMMINSSRNSAHLAQGMSNHILAHPSEGLKVAKGEVLSVGKNAKQWNLDKVDPQENVNIPHPQKAPKMAQDPKHNCKVCDKGPCECA